MNDLKIAACIGRPPPIKGKKILSTKGTTEMVKNLVNKECDYIQTQPLKTPEERQLASSAFHACGNAIGEKLTVYTAANGSVVAVCREDDKAGA